MTVPFVDLAAAYDEVRDELDAAWHRVAGRGLYLQGVELAAFEAEFAAYTGADCCVGVANGLDAIHLTLRALGVGPGDEVIVPSNTYVATWLGVTHCGARPVPVEPDERTFNIDPALIEAAITPKTRAVLPVHLYGHPADMAPIREIADRHGLWVVADAAQAHGARYRGGALDALVHASAWSFYPTKNLGALGDAGAVTTSDAALADRLRVLRNYGSRERYVNEVIGFNSRMEELHAALLRVKLARLDEWNRRRAHAAERYRAGMAGLPVQLPHAEAWAQHAWHLFVVRSPQREQLRAALAERGVATVVHYPVAPHMQAAYRSLGFAPGDLPLARRIHDEVVSLPIGPHLSVEAQGVVVEAMHDALHAVGLR